jgi:hypothetical protein
MNIRMMKRFLLIFILTGMVIQVTQSQDIWKIKRYEAFASLGTSNFFGDIGGFSKSENILGLKDITFKQVRFNVNGGIKYRVMQDVSVRLGLTYGIFRATDVRGSNEDREMSATTSFFEPALIGEYYFIRSKKEGSYVFLKGRKTPVRSILQSLDLYTFTGIGGLSYKVNGNDELVSRGLKDKGFTAVIPVGVGVNLLIQPDYNLGLEIGGRYTFSDYIDGYTSQFSRSNDVYYFLNFTFTYKIMTGRNGLPQFLNKRRF